MTVGQYLSGLPANPLDPDSSPLSWHIDAIDKDEQAAAGTLPYAVVSGLDENERDTSHDDGAFVDQIILIRLYQKAVDGEAPHAAGMYALYRQILQAPKHVTAAGKHRHFMSLTRMPTQAPPTADKMGLGLAARISLRLKFFVP